MATWWGIQPFRKPVRSSDTRRKYGEVALAGENDASMEKV